MPGPLDARRRLRDAVVKTIRRLMGTRFSKSCRSRTVHDMVLHGEVNLDDPLSKYLPKSVRTRVRNGKEITLLDLAIYTSGLPENEGMVDRSFRGQLHQGWH